MLVLRRKREQELMVGNDVTLKVLEIHADWVLIGIEAPRDVPVHRGEVQRMIQRNRDRMAVRPHGATDGGTEAAG